MDILVRDQETYVLAYTQASNPLTPTKPDHKTIVFKSSNGDLETWTEVLNFTKEAFARSFEEINGDFYFGMGSHSKDVRPYTGNILRVKSSSYPH